MLVYLVGSELVLAELEAEVGIAPRVPSPAENSGDFAA